MNCGGCGSGEGSVLLGRRCVSCWKEKLAAVGRSEQRARVLRKQAWEKRHPKRCQKCGCVRYGTRSASFPMAGKCVDCSKAKLLMEAEVRLANKLSSGGRPRRKVRWDAGLTKQRATQLRPLKEIEKHGIASARKRE